MATRTVHQFVATLDNAAGTPVDISSGLISIAPNQMVRNVGAHNVFGSSPEKVNEGGYGEQSVTLEGEVDNAANEPFTLINAWYFTAAGGKRTFKWETPDGTSGSDQYTGEVVLVNFDPGSGQAGQGDVQRFRATLRYDAGVTHSVIV